MSLETKFMSPEALVLIGQEPCVGLGFKAFE